MNATWNSVKQQGKKSIKRAMRGGKPSPKLVIPLVKQAPKAITMGNQTGMAVFPTSEDIRGAMSDQSFSKRSTYRVVKG
jgi:hypothetical protein